jgi:hypothetical protein
MFGSTKDKAAKAAIHVSQSSEAREASVAREAREASVAGKRNTNNLISVCPSDVIVYENDTGYVSDTSDVCEDTSNVMTESQNTLMGNRRWIRRFKSEGDNYKNINNDIIRQYSSMSSMSLSSLSDNFDKSSKDIFRISLDKVSGPIIHKLKNTHT